MKAQTFKERFATTSIFAVLVATFFIGGIFYWLYSTARQNILNVWQSRIFHIAQEVGYYLRTPIDAISFTAVKVNAMLAGGANNEEISKYLIAETEVYSIMIEGNETGIYGFCNGEYLDSSGWVPDKNYVPQDRPWYKAAVVADGKVALVEPYRNLQTLTMMMSVSQLLNDKKSVISMDIFLGKVQEIVSNITANDGLLEMAMVINEKGVVVAHSNKAELGKKYMNDKAPTFGRRLTEKIILQENNVFSITNENKNYMILTEEITSNWYMVLILNETKMFRSLQYIYLFSALTMLIVLCAIFAVFYFMERKHAENEKLNREIKAVADIYAGMAKVDLRTDTITILRSNRTLDGLLDGDYTNFSKRIVSMMKRYSADQSRTLMENFVNPATLNERMTKMNSISHEFLDKNDLWMRVRFIAVERDSEENLQSIIMAFESIDEDKKLQESLRELSEMDAMTKIRNRGSGEALVRNKMADGKKGMFCLLDADKFKSINDNYGHAVGDKVIIEIANCLKKTFRDSDVFFRLGGDEFAVYACDVTDEETGKNIFSRFFKNLDKIEIPELGERKVCVSVGATFYPATTNDSFEALYERADSGLYDSKKIDGNYITFHLQK